MHPFARGVILRALIGGTVEENQKNPDIGMSTSAPGGSSVVADRWSKQPGIANLGRSTLGDSQRDERSSIGETRRVNPSTAGEEYGTMRANNCKSIRCSIPSRDSILILTSGFSASISP